MLSHTISTSVTEHPVPVTPCLQYCSLTKGDSPFVFLCPRPNQMKANPPICHHTCSPYFFFFIVGCLSSSCSVTRILITETRNYDLTNRNSVTFFFSQHFKASLIVDVSSSSFSSFLLSSSFCSSMYIRRKESYTSSLSSTKRV